MDNQPTEEEIRKFWEWCGFKAEYHDADLERNIGKGHIVTGFWNNPISHKLIPMNQLPTLDLNNLFKYAVPKLQGISLGRNYVADDNSDWCADICLDTTGWVDKTNKDPTLALFWAIYEVTNE